MAHELRLVSDRADMAYVGKTPWHGLGQRLTDGAPIDVWLREAGMDFKVCRSRVRFGEAPNQQVWDAQHVLFRSDTHAPLAVVGDGYRIVQPAEVLEFFRDLCVDQGLALETAGVLAGGARYWALARLPLDFCLTGGDRVTGYVLLATSADGSMATNARVTSVRVVCANTLAMATAARGKNSIYVRHSSEFRASAVKVDLGLVSADWTSFADGARRLAARRLTKAEAVLALIDAIGDRAAFDAGEPIADQPNARALGEIISLYTGQAIGADLAGQTAWGLLNAATEYYDHHAGRRPDSRLTSAWWGDAAKRKAAVHSAVLKLAA